MSGFGTSCDKGAYGWEVRTQVNTSIQIWIEEYKSKFMQKLYKLNQNDFKSFIYSIYVIKGPLSGLKRSCNL